MHLLLFPTDASELLFGLQLTAFTAVLQKKPEPELVALGLTTWQKVQTKATNVKVCNYGVHGLLPSFEYNTPVALERSFEKSVHIPYIYCPVCRSAGDLWSAIIKSSPGEITADLKMLVSVVWKHIIYIIIFGSTVELNLRKCGYNLILA